MCPPSDWSESRALMRAVGEESFAKVVGILPLPDKATRRKTTDSDLLRP